MADQDFKINIVTLADLTGIKLTQQQLTALQTAAAKGNQQAIGALRQLADAQKQASASLTAGFTGSAIGVGTIVGLVTGAIKKWQAFNEEQDRMVEQMIKAQEKTRALGESIIDIQDDMISLRRVGAEPLEQSFNRLNQEIIRLKTEQSLLDLPRQGDEWKKLNADIATNEALLKRVTSAQTAQKAASDKAAVDSSKAAEKKRKDEQSFLAGAISSSSNQTKAVLQNELAAQQARAAGQEKVADQYQKTADQLEKSMTPAQREELEGLRKATTKPVGRKAEVGESQPAVDEIEFNRLNNIRAQAGLKPLTKSEYKDQELLMELKDLNNNFDKLLDIWR